MKYLDLYTNDREVRALLSIITEPGDFIVGHLVDMYGPYWALNGLLSEQWNDEKYPYFLKFERSEVTKARLRLIPRVHEATRQPTMGFRLTELEDRGIHFLIPGDFNYPAGLAALGHGAPFGLWVRAQSVSGGLFDKAVAIVGARAATSYGDHVAMELSADLAGSGYTIVSGAAYGIDGAAHRAAIAAGGKTVAFLAGGVDRMYPAGHQELATRMIEGGHALMSEVPPGSAPTKWRFLQRNRLIAAATQGSVIVEAGWRSGSLNEAMHAQSIGRPVGAVPGPVTSAASAGCHRLIQGFGATLITSADDVRQMLGDLTVQNATMGALAQVQELADTEGWEVSR